MYTMVFNPCNAKPDIWMRRPKYIWEYITVYVGDLPFAAHDQYIFVNLLQEKYGYKLKGAGVFPFIWDVCFLGIRIIYHIWPPRRTFKRW